MGRLSRFGWRVLRVAGNSMEPALHAGDYVVLCPYSRRRTPRSGDVVSFRTASGQQMIKRLRGAAGGDRWSVVGDGVLSMPSVDLGLIPSSAFDGRVVWRVRGPRRQSVHRTD